MDDTNTSVRTEVTVDPSTGVATWFLRIVDPDGDADGWPLDPYAGFLPPNDETHRGEGRISYRIKVREDAPANVVITNSATIVFDYNDPIETDPAWWNTVTAGGEAGFASAEQTVDEGGTLKVVVNGGNVDLASSVQVQVMYNTAAAVVPETEPDAQGAFKAVVHLYFAPNEKKGFAGAVRLVRLRWTGTAFEVE